MYILRLKNTLTYFMQIKTTKTPFFTLRLANIQNDHTLVERLPKNRTPHI